MRERKPARATLSEGALPPLLGGLQRARASGWLRVSGMEVSGGVPTVWRLSLRLREGRVVAVDADTREEGTDGRPLDLADRATGAIARVFRCRDAVQSWEPDPRSEQVDPSAPWLAALAVRAVDRLPSADAVAAVLGDVARRLVPCAASETEIATLTAAQRSLLSRVPAGLTGSEVLALGGESAARDLLALLCVGAAEWEPAAAGHADRDDGPPRTDRGDVAAKAPRTRAAAPPLPPPPPSAPAPTRAAGDLRRRIEETHRALRGANHFAVLGLTPSASTDDVRQAYARHARRYHPDAQHDPLIQELRPKLTDIFVAVSAAYGVLRDPVLRERYERTLGLRTQVPPPAAAPIAAASTAAPESAGDPIEARLLRAEEALAARQPWEAIRLLEEAVPATDGALRRRVQIALARAYADRDRPRDAEKMLLDVLQADPRAVSACLLLGRIYRQSGRAKRARGMFERALEVDPGQAEARQELSSLGEAAPEVARPASLLSRLRDRR